MKVEGWLDISRSMRKVQVEDCTNCEVCPKFVDPPAEPDANVFGKRGKAGNIILKTTIYRSNFHRRK